MFYFLTALDVSQAFLDRVYFFIELKSVTKSTNNKQYNQSELSTRWKYLLNPGSLPPFL